MMLYLTHIRPIRQLVAPEQTSCMQLPRFLESMFLLYIMSLIKKMELSNPLPLSETEYRRRSVNS